MKLWYAKHNHHWNVFDGYSVLCAVDSEEQAENIVHCVNNYDRLVDALRDVTEKLERNTCLHEETCRGGAIWEICRHCGEKWADDEGGKPPFGELPEIENARALLAKLDTKGEE